MKVLGFARVSPSFATSFAWRKGWGTLKAAGNSLRNSPLKGANDSVILATRLLHCGALAVEAICSFARFVSVTKARAIWECRSFPIDGRSKSNGSVANSLDPYTVQDSRLLLYHTVLQHISLHTKSQDGR